MSTRSTTHFTHGDELKPVAIIYRHPDGDPEGAGVDLLDFIRQCRQLKDPRFTDPSYLAAKYVVFLADMFNYEYDDDFKKIRPASRLAFISVGVLDADPGDIEYRYVVDCRNLTSDRCPKVTCYKISGTTKSKWQNWEKTEVPIPVGTD